MRTKIRPKTVKIINRLIKPLTEEGVIEVEEEKEILAQLKNLASKGEQLPDITPKLIDRREASEMLGISLANFKKLEKEGQICIPQKKIGSSIRYRNYDVCRFIMEEEAESDN